MAFENKNIIGMIHLKALPGSPRQGLSLDEIFSYAKSDLSALEKGGVNAAIVENFFDYPYTVKPSLETLTAYTHLFTRLKAAASIPLGVNIQYTDGDEEMLVAALCGADFIRAETFVENRCGSFGMMRANCAALARCRKNLDAKVKIFADINVKHTFPLSPQPLEYSISEAKANGADALIITGLQTGQAPSIEDVQSVKKLCGDSPLYLGSGISEQNIAGYLAHIDGVIAGSSIKEKGIIENPVSESRVKALVLQAGKTLS